MTLKEKQLEFIIYCIENTAERLGRYSADVYNKLKELGAIDGYINAFYDTLHTQGKAYIVDSLLDHRVIHNGYRKIIVLFKFRHSKKGINHINCLSWFYLPCRTTFFCYLLSFTASSIRDTNCGLLGRAVVPKSTICPFLLINR